ncbi:TPA: hypothetical protein DEP96_01475 [Candidatus Uhrbacteria bacterium]|nr:hypothetical protein [Candidatus Uhrbacteria bacterium]
MKKPHIVIVGGGFGGLEVAWGLRGQVKQGKIAVTLINITNYFLFTPLLHEVATGGLSAASVAEPLREVFAHTGLNIIQGEVTKVDADKKAVFLGHHTIPYDVLVLSTGATTNYFNTPGAAEFALPLKTLADATAIRARIIDAFETASLVTTAAERKELLSFVVVGAGATGVELAAELAEFAFHIARRYFCQKNSCILHNEVSVTLVSAGPELLAQFSPPTRKAAEARLKKLGVKLRLGVQVGEVDATGVNMNDGWRIPSGLTIWTAGVKAVLPLIVDSSGTKVAKAQLWSQAKKPAELVILGDAAAGLPMLAQVAVAQGRSVANNIVLLLASRPLLPFVYHSRGSFVSLGQWFAAGTIGRINLSGRLTWWLWRTVYLFKFASHKKRLRIVFEWTLNLFYPRDITRL